MAANGYIDDNGNWVPDQPDSNYSYPPVEPNGPIKTPSLNPGPAYNPDPNAPRMPLATSTPDYASQITKQYQTSLGRAPTAAELASDTANAQKYGTGGSLLSDIAARAGNTPGVGDRQGGGATQPSSGSSSSQPQYASDLIKQMMDRQSAQDVQQRQRGDNLYNLLNERANQGLAVDRTNPVIRAQADAFSAQQDRAARNSISNAAEAGNQYTNIEGTRRMAAERAGQASGAFEANLMGQEINAKRQEIAQALQGQAGLLTADQTNQLQRQMSLLDAAAKQQQIGLGQSSLAQDWQKALLANEQYNNGLGFNYANLYSNNYNNYGQYPG